MTKINKIQSTKKRRAIRTRKKLSTRLNLTHRENNRLRLSVHRTNKNIYVQIIDDLKNKTIANASTKELKEKGTKKDLAAKVGSLIAEKAKKSKIKQVVFDKGSYRYHGRVKALAEEARKGGLEF